MIHNDEKRNYHMLRNPRSQTSWLAVINPDLEVAICTNLRGVVEIFKKFEISKMNYNIIKFLLNFN